MKTNQKIQFNKVFMLSIAIFGVFLLFRTISVNASVDNEGNYLELEREIINQLNQERVDHDLVALQFSDILKKAARMKLDDMITKKYFSHTSPDRKTPWYWFEQAGYDYKFAGENLATKFTTASEVHKAWMNSKTHRENILFPEYKDVAVVVGKNSKGELIAVELFGRMINDDGNILTGGIISPEDKNTKEEDAMAVSSTSIIPEKIKEVDSLPHYTISFNNLLLLLIGGMCLILVVNVWILEKEEERIILELKRAG